MTVAAIKPSVEYAGTPFGTTGPFPIADAGRAIPFLNPDHIVVTRVNAAGEREQLIYTVDYIINDNAVTFTSNESGLLPNERLLIERVTPIESTLDLVNGQAVSSAAIEDSVDYLTFLAQEINDRIGRAVPPIAAGAVTILPSASDPATLSLSQDQDGVYRLALGIPRGLQGVAGPAPNLAAGVVTTLDVGANPTLAFRSTSPGTIALDLGLPRGAPPILTPGVVQTLPSNQLATFGVRATGPASYALDIGIPAGQTGAAAAIEIGTVTTLASGQAATASVTPVSLSLYRLNLGLPRGNTGPAPTISVGNVTTLSTGQPATAAVRELAPGSFALDLGLPRGAAAVAGQYMVITPSDAGETITFAVSQSGLDARYALGSALTTVGDRVTALENATPSVDPTLDALAALNTQADRLAYFTGVDTAALATLTSTARNLLSQPSEADMRTLLQLGSAATISAPASGVNASATQVVRGDDTRVLAGGAGGVNRLLNWDFSDGLTGWSIPSGGGNTTGLTLQSGLNYVDGATTYGRGDKQVAYARIVGSPAAGTFWDIFSAPVVVAPGERLSYSVEVAYYRCAVPRVRLFGYDAAGVSQGELAGVTGGSNSATAGVSGENMTRVAGFVDLPSNSILRSVRMLIQAEGTGAANPLLLATRAAVQAVSAGTSVHPPQAPGIVAAGGGGLLDTTGYNAGRVQEGKAPVYIPAWITPEKVGAIGNGVADDTAAFQTMMNDGRPVCLTRPPVAWRLSSLTVPANRQIFSDGIRPTIQHFGANALWRVQGSNVRVGDFRVECTATNKAATNAPIFAIDVSAINIERVDFQNVIGFWTGGVLHDIGTVGQYDEVRLERVLTYLQRGVGLRLLRSYAGFWTDYVFMEWLRGQPGTANGGLYLDETVADINHPMVQIGSNQAAGAGGQLFQRTYCQGTNRQDCPDNHGYLLTGPAGGVRLQWCDVDGSGGNAFDATFFDELELYDVRFTSIWGHNIRLDECSNVRGSARLTGRSGNPDGSNANRHGVFLVRDCARVDLQATITGTTGCPRRVEGRDLHNDLVSIPNRTRRGHERVHLDIDDGSQIGGGDLLDPAITYLTAPFGVSASGTPDTQITGPVWASGGTGGVASVGRVGFAAPQLLAVNAYTRSVVRFNQTTAASVNPNLQIRLQPLELLSEQWVTVDFWARCETAPTTLLVRLWKVYGTGGSASESVTDEDVSVDATWRQFSRSFRAPSTFGKTVGAGSYGFVGIYLPISVTRAVDFALLRVRWGSDLTPLQVPVNGLTFS